MQMLIIGGAGNFGRFYSEFFAKNGFEITVFDTDKASAEKFCNEKGFAIAKKIEEAKNFGFVLLCVPNSMARSVAKKTIPLLKPKALFFDFCSTKSEIVELEESFAKKQIELVSVHPMHGPRISSLEGVPIIFIPIKAGEKYSLIKKVFEESLACIVETTLEKHEKYVSIIQGMTHFVQIASALALKEAGANFKELNEFATPVFRLYLDTMARVVLQNPEMYAELQFSCPDNDKMRNLFIKNAKQLEEICVSGNREKLVKTIIDAAQFFEKEDLILLESDRLVNAMKSDIAKLKKFIGKKILLQNTVSKKLHYAEILEVDAKQICIKETRGIQSSIPLYKLRIPSKEEALEWKQKNLKKTYFDYSFFVPSSALKQIVLKALSAIFKQVSFEIIDEYTDTKKSGQKSITIRANFFTEDKKGLDEQIKKAIKGLGLEPRG